MPKVRAEWNAIFTEPTPIAAFARLAIPTRYLVGGATTSAPRRVAELVSAVLPMVRVVELPGIGHMGPVTHPDPVNAEILASLEA
jgi:pimeloyl-ACP methyl ester carboxylesterase